MHELFSYTSPLGIIGSLDYLILLNLYMMNLLNRRNSVIKFFAESDRWREVLPEE